MFYVIAIIVSAIVFVPTGYVIRKRIATKKRDSLEKEIEDLLEKAKVTERDMLHKAKESAFNVIEDAKREEKNRRKEINHIQQRLEKRESLFDKKILEIENKQEELHTKAQKIENIKKEIHEIKQNQLDKLEKIAELSPEEAKDIILENTEKEIKTELLSRIRKVQEENYEEKERQAKNILSNVILRCASSHVADVTTTVVEIPNDEMKGRIIGREGRNIKTIEKLTGVEIIIDDTPEAITISGFNPIRRHIAKKSLEKLILDGRIHPTRIEETIEAAKKEIAADIKKAGEEASYKTGVAGLDHKLLQILGRLKYRTSYGQNVLLHSVEVAQLSALLAEELGANVNVCRKAGLLHDIGKALDHEVQGTHPEIGKDIANKFKLPPEIIAPIAEHHDDQPTTLEGLIVKVADAISGGRPAARKDTYEFYLQRLRELEDLANSFEGIDKSYAIQAGREIRIFVSPDKIDDLEAMKLARNIANKVEEELKYPGEIKVNVIREKRFTEYAR